MVKIIAHRGASMEAPENTLSAFRKAIDLRAHLIECDVQITKDHVPIIFHDDILYKKHINELSFKEVRTWDAGNWFLNCFSGEKIPSLEEFLNLSFLETNVFFELKGEMTSEDLTQIAKMIKKKPPKKYYVGSLIPSLVEKLSQIDSSLTLVGIATSEEDIEDFLSIKPHVLALRHQLITPKMTKRLHQAGIEIWVWTIDDPGYDVTHIDGVITNNLARFLQTHANK